MADAEQQPKGSAQEFTWIHCAGCGKGLWRRFPDYLEMTVSPRGREKRVINVSLEAASVVSVTCEKCGTVCSPVIDQ